MECSHVMTTQITFLTPQKTLRDVANIMRNVDIGLVPICDDSKRVVGVLTDRDVVVRALAEDRPLTTSVSEVMTRDIKSCRPDDDVAHVRKIMSDEQVSRIVVTGADEHLMGIISLTDLMQADQHQAADAQNRVKQGEKPADNPHNPTSPSYESENLRLQLERAQNVSN